jgi:hemolysin activation/secretion protein
MEDLESLRRDLTLLYVNKGYINSGAVIPDQSVSDGQITLQVIEGRVANIDVTGDTWFAKSYIRNRIARSTGVPVNIQPLQERLQLLQQDQRIQRIHAELRPGARLGESELKVEVEDKPPISLWLAYNNYQSPSVGAERGLATLAHQNLSGHGDVLSFTYGFSKGLNPLLDASYAVPITSFDTTLQFRYRKNDAKVVDQVFGPLNIVSKTESFELAVRQPIYRTLSQELVLSLSAEHERTDTSLLGEPFSFSPGVVNGRSVVVPIRFAQEWTYRTQRQVLAARSRFSFGLDAWDATINGAGKTPDGEFFAWLGQLQWAQILNLLDIQLLSRLDAQVSNNPLLPVEQFGIGGRYSVRGYRENMLVKDNVFIASLEARVPLVQNRRLAEYLQLCPFVDYGRGTNVDIPDSGPTELASIGAGLRWGAAPFKLPFGLRADAELYWGQRLKKVDLPHEDLQDDGIHYQIAITGFF